MSVDAQPQDTLDESQRTATPDEPVPAPRRARWLPWLSAAFAVGFFFLVRESLTDDAYITLSYAKNLALHFEWSLIPGSPANSATSPLDVLLLGLLSFGTRISGSVHPVVALGVLNVVCAFGIGWAWQRLTRAFGLASWVGVLGVLVVLANPFLLSATGLEVLLIPAVLLVMTVCAVEARPAWFGVFAGLAVLTRLDLIVFVLLVAFCTRAIRRKLLRAVLFAVLTSAPWFVFSWFAFGSAVPDTLVIKQAQDGLFGIWSYFTGPVMYFTSQKLAVLMTFLPALLGVIALCAWFGVRFARRWDGFPKLGPVAALGSGGVLYYLVYSKLGVGPYHWYYVTPVVTTATFGVFALGVWLAQARTRPVLTPGTPLAAFGVVAVLLAGTFVVDGRQGVPWPSPVIFGNWASAKDYARVGEALGKRLNGASVAAPGEIGTLAYYCDCRILDEFSDRGVVTGLLEKQIAEGGAVKKFALKLNYYWYDHGRRPVRPDYRLLYDKGPATGPDSWTVFSAAKGVNHFTLVPNT